MDKVPPKNRNQLPETTGRDHSAGKDKPLDDDDGDWVLIHSNPDGGERTKPSFRERFEGGVKRLFQGEPDLQDTMKSIHLKQGEQVHAFDPGYGRAGASAALSAHPLPPLSKKVERDIVKTLLQEKIASLAGKDKQIGQVTVRDIRKDSGGKIVQIGFVCEGSPHILNAERSLLRGRLNNAFFEGENQEFDKGVARAMKNVESLLDEVNEKVLALRADPARAMATSAPTADTKSNITEVGRSRTVVNASDLKEKIQKIIQEVSGLENLQVANFKLDSNLKGLQEIVIEIPGEGVCQLKKGMWIIPAKALKTLSPLGSDTRAIGKALLEKINPEIAKWELISANRKA